MAEGEKSPRQLMAIGVLGGLICIYIANYLNSWTNSAWFSFIAALGAILAVYYGADAVRRVASYGLGTGVPSIAILSFGAGQIAVLLGLAVGMNYGIAMAASLVILGLSTAIAGSFTFTAIMSYVVASGFIIAVFIVGAMAMFHPFNACLGPDERQVRTLNLALSTGFTAMIVAGIASGAINGVQAAVPMLIVAICGWIIYYMRFWADTKVDAAAVLSTGLIPTEEEVA